MGEEKPLSNILRARHDSTGKRSWQGKSVRRLQRYEASSRADQSAEVTGSNGWSRPAWPESRRRLVTCIECDNDNAPTTLDNDRAWEWLPALLEENAVKPPTLDKGKTGRGRGAVGTNAAATVYTLEALAEQIEARREGEPSRSEKRQARARRGQPRGGAIYTLVRKKRPALFATPPTDAPEGVNGALLTPRTVGGRGGRHSTAALVRQNRPEAAFDVGRAGGVGARKAYLEVDLGRDCELTEISTQGRHPPTRVYPHVRDERRAARRAAHGRIAYGDDELEGRYAVEGQPWWSLARDGPYEGPYWDVLELGEGRLRPLPQPPPRHLSELQWVTRYEITVREAGGRAWRSLGVHKGNDDATSEAVHSLSQFKGGVRARFVRFRPLDVVGGGALRVGVYGRPGDAQGAGRATGRQAGVGGGDAGDADGPQLVTYRLGLPCARAGGSAYAVKSGRGGRCRCSYCHAPQPSRTSRKAEVRRAANGPREE